MASLSLLVVVPTLAAFSVLPWWSLAVVVAELAAVVVWLRHAAVTERAARRARSRTRPANTSAPSTKLLAPRARASEPRYADTSTRRASRPAAQAEPVLAAPSAEVAEVAERAESPAVSPAEVDLSGWAPVPVPPPTYTLKAMAERPQPVPAAVSEPATTLPSSFGGLVDEGELDELLDRRRAAGA